MAQIIIGFHNIIGRLGAFNWAPLILELVAAVEMVEQINPFRVEPYNYLY